jgi:hypothetical protein
MMAAWVDLLEQRQRAEIGEDWALVHYSSEIGY